MTYEAFLESIQSDSALLQGLSLPLQALWLVRKDRWEEAHDRVDEMTHLMGDWIHAHLHLIEGDLTNAAYWYREAGKAVNTPEQIDSEWHEIVRSNFGG